ncbi:MAG: hypothetical protein ABIT07_05425 [Ferruginibacter sp.]
MDSNKKDNSNETNILTFLFKKEDIKRLVSEDFEYVLVHVGTKVINCNDKHYASLTVDATAYDKKQVLAMKVNGCPVPPCDPNAVT